MSGRAVGGCSLVLAWALLAASLAAQPAPTRKEKAVVEGETGRRQQPSPLQAPPAHPYLFFTRAEVPALRAKARTGPAGEAWEGVLRGADRLLATPPPRPDALPAERPWGWQWRYSGSARTLAFVYAITGKREYAERARPELQAALSITDWTESGHPGEADLISAEVSFDLACAYDWMYDALSEAERAHLREVLLRLGLEPIFKASQAEAWWASWYRGNWGAVIHGQAGVAAMALLAADPRAAGWVRICRDKIRHYTQAIDRDGGWGEGVSYACYAWSRATRFMAAWDHLTRGQDSLLKAPGLKRLPSFFTHMLLPDGSGFVPFANCWGGTDFPADFLVRLAAEFHDGRAMWTARRMDWRGIFGFLWMDNRVAPMPPEGLPTTRLFRDLNWAVLRSRWGDPQATLLGLKGGEMDWDHQHHDHNSFTLYAFGRSLLIDLNYPHQLWGCGTEAHNTVMVNGREQRGRVNVAGGRQPREFRTVLGGLVDAPWYTRLVGDASAGYEPADVKSFQREVLYLRHASAVTPPDYFLLFDDLAATAPARLDWMLHTYGDLFVKGRTITVRQDDAAADVTLLAPEAFQHEIAARSFQEAGVEEPFPTAKAVTYIKVRPAERVQRGRFLAVIAPRRAGDPAAVRPEAVRTPSALGARIISGPVRDLALFALAAPRMEAEGVTGAGRTCFVRRGPRGILAAALHRGTRLEAGGRLLLAAERPGDLTLSLTNSQVAATVSLPSRSTVTLFAGRRPKCVTVDGKPVRFRYDAGTRCVTLSLDGQHAVRVELPPGRGAQAAATNSAW